MTHMLHRTSNIDKKYGVNTLDNDLCFLAMSAKRYANQAGSGPKMQKILQIATKHNPTNFGDMIGGNSISSNIDAILKKVNETSIVHGIFTTMEDAVAFVNEVKAADLGISVVLSAPTARAWELVEKTGTMLHTQEFSGGIWGKKEYLPSEEVLDFCTMCGHGMISRYLVEDMIKRVKAGRISADKASREIGRACCCGIYNINRGKVLLETLAKAK
jgi:hypothetical protein